MMALEEEGEPQIQSRELSKTLGGGRLPFPLNNNKQTATLINYTLEYYCISQIQIMLMRRGFFVVPELSLFEFHGSGGMWFCCSMMVM